MNTPVSFELAKLLKEKGYRVLPDFKSSYPTIAEVVMWLYEKHGIWIKNDVISINRVIKFYSSYYKINDGLTQLPIQLNGNFNSPTEAYEAAIEYALKNLIQEEEQKTKVVNIQDKERQRIYEKILNRKME